MRTGDAQTRAMSPRDGTSAGAAERAGHGAPPFIEARDRIRWRGATARFIPKWENVLLLGPLGTWEESRAGHRAGGYPPMARTDSLLFALTRCPVHQVGNCPLNPLRRRDNDASRMEARTASVIGSSFIVRRTLDGTSGSSAMRPILPDGPDRSGHVACDAAWWRYVSSTKIELVTLPLESSRRRSSRSRSTPP
jgi:hypothetical protein